MTQKQPKVSVVIPIYNRGDLIGATIQSVLDQSFQDFEILVVDDGSTDNTRQVVCGMKDSRIFYIYQKNTGRPAGPRNEGIRKARGTYVAFLDSDDLWLPYKLALQVEFLDRHPDVGLIYGQHQPFGNGTEGSAPIPSVSTASSGKIFKSLFLSWNFIPCLTVVTRRTVLERVGGFDDEPLLEAVEDFELWLRIARVYNIHFVPEVISKYRFHEDQLAGVGIAVLFLRNLNIALKFKKWGWVNFSLFIRRVLRLYLFTAKVLMVEGKFSTLFRVSQAAYYAYTTCEFIDPEKLDR